MIRILALASAFVVGACGGSAKKESAAPAPQPLENKALPAAEPAAVPAPSPESPEGAMMALAAFTAKMCSCADSACAEHVSDEMTEWARNMAKNQSEPIQMTEDDQKRAVEMGTRMGECMQKAMNVGAQPARP